MDFETVLEAETLERGNRIRVKTSLPIFIFIIFYQPHPPPQINPVASLCYTNGGKLDRMTSHSNKKKRSLPPQQQYPQKYSSRLTADHEDISRISYPFASGGAIVTPIVPFDVKGMVFERLKEELLPKLNVRWNRTCRLHNVGDEDKIKTTAAETVVRSRFIIGKYSMHSSGADLRLKPIRIGVFRHRDKSMRTNARESIATEETKQIHFK